MLKKVILFLALSLLSLTVPTLADAPNRMNFQGRLTDPSGNPLTGTYSIRFSIWTLSVGGTELWSETQPAVSVSNGLFNVELGVTVIDEIDDSVLFQTESRYLEIKVGDDPPLTPRQKLMSAPYAFSLENEPGLAEANKKDSIGIALSTTPANILSRGLSIQTDGWVIVTISGYFRIDPAAVGNDQWARATISTTSGVMVFNNLALFGGPAWPATAAPGFEYFSPFSLTRVFAVGPGSHTYYLVADKYNAADVVFLGRPEMVLLFVPESKGAITGLAAEAEADLSAGVPGVGPSQGPSVPAEVSGRQHVPEGEEQ